MGWIHTHSIAGMAVSALDCGLLPITQTAMYFGGVGMHEYESVAIDLAEQERLVRDLGITSDDPAQPRAARGRPDGLGSLHEPFLARARVQGAGGRDGVQHQAASSCSDVIDKTAHLYDPKTRRRWGPLEWPALLRLADRKYPGFRD